MSVLRVGILGLGGFARTHFGALWQLEDQGELKVESVFARSYYQDRYAETRTKIEERGMRVYTTFEDFMRGERDRLDLLSIATSIDSHEEFTVAALEAGWDVTCEKPVAATVDEVHRMIEAKNRTGKIVAIGYQNIFSDSIQRLKEWIVSGRLGKVKRAVTNVRWPRKWSYYDNSSWKGRIKSGDRYVMDSPVQNATAHYLMNILYLCGATHQDSALPVSVKVEAYHAYPIESFDTANVLVTTDSGATVRHIASHACPTQGNPVSLIECENGKVRYEAPSGETKVQFNDGTVETFDNGGKKVHFQAFDLAIPAIREGREPICTLENSLPQVVVVNGIHEALNPIPEIGAGHAARTDLDGDHAIAIKGFDELVDRCVAEDIFFADAGAPWAINPVEFDLRDYRHFSGLSKDPGM
ncbi:MAG: Gfo/Idh/MocA family oxidoreductase [Planctomycetes bacterium]|nr:Gfo/Idh/MocA family oxidoreductase [Planctomycetota bacterium]